MASVSRAQGRLVQTKLSSMVPTVCPLEFRHVHRISHLTEPRVSRMAHQPVLKATYSMAKLVFTASFQSALPKPTFAETPAPPSRDLIAPRASSSHPRVALRESCQTARLKQPYRGRSVSLNSRQFVYPVRSSTMAPALPLMARYVLLEVSCVQRVAWPLLFLRVRTEPPSKITNALRITARLASFHLLPWVISVYLLICQYARQVLYSPMVNAACLQRMVASVCNIALLHKC
jgi:hypothetical protein